MIPILEQLVPESLWALKCPYPMEAEKLCVHNTANDAPAVNEASFVHNNPEATSFHFAVDDALAVQILPLTRCGWHAGDGALGAGNRKSIGIEICYSKSGGERFRKAQENAAVLCAYLMHEYGWGLDLSHVTKHEDYSQKHCPHRTLDDYGWEYFLGLVSASYEELYPEEIPMTKEEKVYYDAKIEALERKLAPIEESINWMDHITPDVGGDEAKSMMADLVQNGDFKGVSAARWGWNKLGMRILLVVYRMLKRIISVNGLKWE